MVFLAQARFLQRFIGGVPSSTIFAWAQTNAFGSSARNMFLHMAFQEAKLTFWNYQKEKAAEA
jgi:hypothetical protein